MDLNPDVVFGKARASVIGCEGEIHDVVESTMDTARRLAAKGVPDGYVVLAEEQRSGRGRTGAWECRRGDGILMSVVLRLAVRADERRLIATLGAVSAAEAVQHFGPDAKIKWPNDVVVLVRGDTPQGPEESGAGPPRQPRIAPPFRKMGGVLVESATCKGDSAPAHLLGIGLNVNQDRRRLPACAESEEAGRGGLPATSVKIELGRQVDRSELCRILLGRLDHWYGRLRHGRAEALLARWRTLSCLMGESVRAVVRTSANSVEPGRAVIGKVIGLRATGELILQPPEGGELLLREHEAKLIF